MKVRRGYLVLALGGLSLLLLDSAQRWVYVNRLPVVPSQIQGKGETTRALSSLPTRDEGPSPGCSPRSSG